MNECGTGMRQNPQNKFPICVGCYTVTCYIGWRMCCACKCGIFIWRTRDWRIVDTEIVDMRSRTRPERWAFISVIHRYVSNYKDTTRWCSRKQTIRHRTFCLSGAFLHSLYGAHYMQCMLHDGDDEYMDNNQAEELPAILFALFHRKLISLHLQGLQWTLRACWIFNVVTN